VGNGFGGGQQSMAGGQWGMQATLRREASLSGIGVHGGLPVSMTLLPADAGAGIAFVRTDVGEGGDRVVRADLGHIGSTELCTTVAAAGLSVATIEHLMAALSVFGIDNALIEIDGPEVPVMDGSAEAFVDAIDRAGVATLDAPRRYIRVLRPVQVAVGDAVAEFTPRDRLRVEVEIDFANELVGRQTFAADIDRDRFRRDLAPARTFGFMADVEQLWARGFARGASLENAVVVADDRIVNPGGLRYPDEFVRHKALDAVGDLALAGAPILGCFRSRRGGHRLNVAALTALFADADAWTFVSEPWRREAGHAEAPAGLAVAAFGPEAS